MPFIIIALISLIIARKAWLFGKKIDRIEKQQKEILDWIGQQKATPYSDPLTTAREVNID